jgi:hypothetical protein
MLFKSNAKQCEAMRSNAKQCKQCKAIQSNAKQCEAMRSNTKQCKKYIKNVSNAEQCSENKSNVQYFGTKMGNEAMSVQKRGQRFPPRIFILLLYYA